MKKTILYLVLIAFFWFSPQPFSVSLIENYGSYVVEREEGVGFFGSSFVFLIFGPVNMYEKMTFLNGPNISKERITDEFRRDLIKNKFDFREIATWVIALLKVLAGIFFIFLIRRNRLRAQNL